MNLCILLALVVANVLVVISSAHTADDLPELDKKLVKNFAKINDYLEKKVDSNNFQDNIDIAKQWKKSKLTMLSDRSFKDALNLIVSLPNTIENVTICKDNWSRKLLERSDSGLSDELHLRAREYPLTRIDRILEHVGYRHVRLCGLDRQKPQMKFAFKQLAYDHINSDLVDTVPSREPEANMKAAEDLLRSLVYKDRSYAEALTQLLMLRATVTEDSCNELGTEIIIRNHLATRNQAHAKLETRLPRRIDNLVRHYSVKHSKVCDPIFQKNCLLHLHQVDLETYRRVLALAGLPYLKLDQFADMVAEANIKEVGEDFTAPSIAKLTVFASDTIGVVYPNDYSKDQLLKYLEVATERDPRSQFLEKVLDEKSGKEILDREKVEELYNEYIYEPCEKFYNIVGPDMELFNYNFRMISSSGPLNFRFLRSAFQSCESVVNNRKLNLNRLIQRLSPRKDRQIYYFG